MFLAVDIGNSWIKFGVFDGDGLTSKFSIPSKREYTADEIARSVGDKLEGPYESAMVCSVVPEVDRAISEYLSRFLGVQPRFATANDLDLKFNFPVDGFGMDRLVNSFAAAEKYGVPVIVVSFGTATTIDVVNKDREYLGGLIAPGMQVGAKALSLSTSKLPEIDIVKPENVIAQATEAAIQSGIVYGQIAMTEGLLKRVIREMRDEPKVVATGGFAKLIVLNIDMVDFVDSDLTLHGLRILSKKPSLVFESGH